MGGGGGHPQSQDKKTKENRKVVRGRVGKKKQKSKEELAREKEKQISFLKSWLNKDRAEQVQEKIVKVVRMPVEAKTCSTDRKETGGGTMRNPERKQIVGETLLEKTDEPRVKETEGTSKIGKLIEKFGGTEKQKRVREKVEEMRQVEKQKKRQSSVRQRVAEIEKSRIEKRVSVKTKKRNQEKSEKSDSDKTEKKTEGVRKDRNLLSISRENNTTVFDKDSFLVGETKVGSANNRPATACKTGVVENLLLVVGNVGKKNTNLDTVATLEPSRGRRF